jgi:uncharacterized protein (DUF2267 family)
VQYQEFLNRVAARSGLPRDRAEVATQLVPALLGESIDEMGAGDLVSELPRQLKRLSLSVPQHGQRYLAHEFLHQVAERERGVQPAARGLEAPVLAAGGMRSPSRDRDQPGAVVLSNQIS